MSAPPGDDFFQRHIDVIIATLAWRSIPQRCAARWLHQRPDHGRGSTPTCPLPRSSQASQETIGVDHNARSAVPGQWPTRRHHQPSMKLDFTSPQERVLHVHFKLTSAIPRRWRRRQGPQRCRERDRTLLRGFLEPTTGRNGQRTTPHPLDHNERGGYDGNLRLYARKRVSGPSRFPSETCLHLIMTTSSIS